jgi:hypothetical protein
MTRYSLCSALVIAFSLNCGCGGSHGEVAHVKKGPMPPGVDWSGTYYTNWGDMKLTQSGSSVVGTFGERNGVIEGTVDGNVLVFHWTEDQRSSLTSSKKKVEGSGIMVYHVIEAGEGKVDEHRIDGTWGYGTKKEGAGTWSGYKSSKDVKEAQRIHLITKGAATKKENQVAGGTDSDYVPPPTTQKKKTLDDMDDLPPPTPK